jgi:hypothetical protein
VLVCVEGVFRTRALDASGFVCGMCKIGAE